MQVLNFWLGEGWETAGPDDTRPGRFKIWFGGGPELDAEIVEHFSGDCDALIRGELDAWEAQPVGGGGAPRTSLSSPSPGASEQPNTCQWNNLLPILSGHPCSPTFLVV